MHSELRVYKHKHHYKEVIQTVKYEKRKFQKNVGFLRSKSLLLTFIFYNQKLLYCLYNTFYATDDELYQNWNTAVFILIGAQVGFTCTQRVCDFKGYIYLHSISLPDSQITCPRKSNWLWRRRVVQSKLPIIYIIQDQLSPQWHRHMIFMILKKLKISVCNIKTY